MESFLSIILHYTRLRCTDHGECSFYTARLTNQNRILVLHSFLYLTFLQRKIFIRIIKIAISIFIRISYKITYTCGSFSLTIRISFRYSINAARDPFRLSLPQELHLLPCRFSSPFFLPLPLHSSLCSSMVKLRFTGSKKSHFRGTRMLFYFPSVSLHESVNEFCDSARGIIRCCNKGRRNVNEPRFKRKRFLRLLPCKNKFVSNPRTLPLRPRGT